MTKSELPAPLNPDALKFYRKQAGLSQQGLADKSKTIKSPISKSQISRWERGEQTGNIRQNSRKRLERALGVHWEVLTRPLKEDDISSNCDRVPLKVGIAGSARTAFTFMQLRYGLLEEAILDLAPLAFLILAEKSLQARKVNLDETVQALEAATSDAYGRHPYMRGAFFDGYNHDWIATERKSLKEREVYEQYVDDERREMSPFVDFLEKELKVLGLFQEHPIEFLSNYRTAPDYAIPVEYLAEGLALDANDEADQRVLELIQEGRIDLWQAWKKKEEATEEAYLAWLAEQRQEVEDGLERQRSKFFSSLKLDLNVGFTPNASEGATPEREDQA